MIDAEEIERLKEELKRLQQALHYEQQALHYEQWLAGRHGHGPGCWKWGPTHYRCALNHIEQITNGQLLAEAKRRDVA
jgi:hypothetical protein